MKNGNSVNGQLLKRPCSFAGIPLQILSERTGVAHWNDVRELSREAGTGFRTQSSNCLLDTIHTKQIALDIEHLHSREPSSVSNAPLVCCCAQSINSLIIYSIPKSASLKGTETLSYVDSCRWIGDTRVPGLKRLEGEIQRMPKKEKGGLTAMWIGCVYRPKGCLLPLSKQLGVSQRIHYACLLTHSVQRKYSSSN